MDNVTHTLTGLALARAGLNRFCPRATALLLISSNIPDIDIIAASKGAFAYFEAHRGYSHSLLLLPVMAALSVAITAALFRTKLPWGKAFALCSIGVGGHLLLDLTNSYGIRLFLPLSPRWFHLDINGLYDVYILMVLAFAAIWPLFARMVSREIGDRASPGRGTAIAALAFFVLFDVARVMIHSQAIEQLEARIYEGEAPLGAAALPDSFTPLRWTGIVETSRIVRAFEIKPLEQFDPTQGGRTFYKPAATAALENAKRRDPFRYFVYFSRFPVWTQTPVAVGDGQGNRVELTDLRFGEPGAGSFHCIALENAENQVLQTWFTFGSGAELGWNGVGGQ